MIGKIVPHKVVHVFASATQVVDIVHRNKKVKSSNNFQRSTIYEDSDDTSEEQEIQRLYVDEDNFLIFDELKKIQLVYVPNINVSGIIFDIIYNIYYIFQIT